MSDVEAGLKHLLHQGMQQIVLVPWCLQHASTDLIKRAASMLQQARPGEVDITTMQRPVLHVHGASPMGPLGGLICVQERLDPSVALCLAGRRCIRACKLGRRTSYCCVLAKHMGLSGGIRIALRLKSRCSTNSARIRENVVCHAWISCWYAMEPSTQAISSSCFVP